jgi:hypothetical protein
MFRITVRKSIATFIEAEWRSAGLMVVKAPGDEIVSYSVGTLECKNLAISIARAAVLNLALHIARAASVDLIN